MKGKVDVGRWKASGVGCLHLTALALEKGVAFIEGKAVSKHGRCNDLLLGGEEMQLLC
jgi:hypothetical protein